MFNFQSKSLASLITLFKFQSMAISPPTQHQPSLISQNKLFSINLTFLPDDADIFLKFLNSEKYLRMFCDHICESCLSCLLAIWDSAFQFYTDGCVTISRDCLFSGCGKHFPQQPFMWRKYSNQCNVTWYESFSISKYYLLGVTKSVSVFRY